ncbi:hypothetical protein XENOCAPTIV_012026 [Xenoophorus captivus]|uniref:Uncharacterized protein n=1 Tax=Xenoophorus captivus TaxID=1517983 RepID=A0ABV0QRC8_9TELE
MAVILRWNDSCLHLDTRSNRGYVNKTAVFICSPNHEICQNSPVNHSLTTRVLLRQLGETLKRNHVGQTVGTWCWKRFDLGKRLPQPLAFLRLIWRNENLPDKRKRDFITCTFESPCQQLLSFVVRF